MPIDHIYKSTWPPSPEQQCKNSLTSQENKKGGNHAELSLTTLVRPKENSRKYPQAVWLPISQLATCMDRLIQIHYSSRLRKEAITVSRSLE
jgi:hypothetical protein